jgi:cytochrome c553
MRITRVLLIVTLVVLAVVAYSAWNFGGFSTRSEPSYLETVLARSVRGFAIPSRARDARNPVPFSSEVWAESRAHFADHCASCHANDGSGQTEIGRNLYPKAPDMRLPATQHLTDGEIYWIIENGVRLTGMPAWGAGGGNDADTWKLVHFIRHINELTDEHLAEMTTFNPKTRAELEEERADEAFLAGEQVETPSEHVH